LKQLFHSTKTGLTKDQTVLSSCLPKEGAVPSAHKSVLLNNAVWSGNCYGQAKWWTVQNCSPRALGWIRSPLSLQTCITS